MPCRTCGSADIHDFCTASDRVRPAPGEQWVIRRCRSCGYGWTHPPLEVDAIAGYYPRTYLAEASRTADEIASGRLQKTRSWRGETEKVRLVERFAPYGRILDVGCGDGRFLLALDPRKWTGSGVDLAAETLAVMRERFPALRLISGGIESTEIEESGYDAITFWHVLEHLPDPEQALRRAVALLRPGGRLFVSLPNLSSLQAGLFRRYWYGFDDIPRHLHHFSRHSLEILLNRAGLENPRHLFFSRRVNFHSLKHSLLNWSQDRFAGRLPYYALKPFLFGLILCEVVTGRWGIFTVVARKPPAR